MNTAKKIAVKIFHVSTISKFPCSQGNGTMEGKLPINQQNSGLYFKGEELSFQNKLPSLLVRYFLAQQHLTGCTSELTAAMSHPAECGACGMLTTEMGSWHDTSWYLGVHPSQRLILIRITRSYGTWLCIYMILGKVSE